MRTTYEAYIEKLEAMCHDEFVGIVQQVSILTPSSKQMSLIAQEECCTDVYAPQYFT